jgi:hypothetical protein
MNRRDTLLATVALVAVAAVTLLAAHIPGLAQAADVLRITHGIASGDVTTTSVQPRRPHDAALHDSRRLAAGVRLTADRDGNQGNPLGFESELRGILTAITAGGVKNHEFIAGPTSAISLIPSPLSRTFTPIELFARGRRSDPTRPSFFNFGVLRIAADGLLTVEIRDAEGVVPEDERGRHGALTLTPAR